MFIYSLHFTHQSTVLSCSDIIIIFDTFFSFMLLMLVNCIVSITGKYLKILEASHVCLLTYQAYDFISSVTWCWMQPTERTRSPA